MHRGFHRVINGNPPFCPIPQDATSANLTLVTDYTVQHWTPSPQTFLQNQQHMIDYPVIDLARGVPLDRLPTGDDRCILTRVVEEAIRTNDHRLMLSQVAEYVVANGLEVGFTPMSVNADQAANQRLRSRILDYRRAMTDFAKRNGHTFN
jgi:hypothetical protein